MKQDLHLQLEKEHIKKNTMKELILGGQDGLVNVLGIVMGVSAAGGTTPIILAAGMAATFAEAISMGAVSYTATLSEHDYYLKELATEEKEIKMVPGVEREEVRAIYRAKGFRGKMLEAIVEQLTKKKRAWAEVMMKDELELEPIKTGETLRGAVVVGLSTLGGSLIPLLPYFVWRTGQTLFLSLGISAAALFLVGFYQAKSYVGNPWKKGGQMLFIGLGAALAGFIVGKVFNVAV